MDGEDEAPVDGVAVVVVGVADAELDEFPHADRMRPTAPVRASAVM